jgi:glycine rich protein
VTEAQFTVDGSVGGRYGSLSGGLGGQTTANISEAPGTDLTILVGGAEGPITCGGLNSSACGGYGGGGDGGEYGGGGGSFVWADDMADPLLVAGGGGGYGNVAVCDGHGTCNSSVGGEGGGTTGGTGTLAVSLTSSNPGGTGGTQTDGGTGPPDGAFEQGGSTLGTGEGGGGGGGYYGGGAGPSTGVSGAGAGGGSGFVSTSDAVTDGVQTAGVNEYQGSVVITYTVPAATADPYTPLTPVRICDTRAGNPSHLTGTAAQCNGGSSNPGAPVPAGGTGTLSVAGSFGVPSDATAVVLNVTVINPAAAGYLTVFPFMAAQPVASNINYVAGEVIPNLVEVGIGGFGGVSIFSSAKTDLAVDVEGFVAPIPPDGGGSGLYDPLSTPARICDTRVGNPSHLTGGAAQCNGAANAGTRLKTGGTIAVQVTGNDSIPSGAIAAVLNVTSVAPAAAGYLTVYPEGGAQPGVSNINYTAGQTSANRVIVPLSSSGQISVYSSAASDVVVDVSGYFSGAGGTGTQFQAETAPVRICDTRPGNPSKLTGGATQCDAQPVGSGKTLTVSVTGLAGVPSGAKAVVVNLTAVSPTVPTYLTVYPAAPIPFVSDLNPVAGEVRANLAVATLSSNGTISIFNDAGSVNVVVDVLGWYS